MATAKSWNGKTYPMYNRGDRVIFTTFGYKGKEGIIHEQATPTGDGTPRWYLNFPGSHNVLIFRADEFELKK